MRIGVLVPARSGSTRLREKLLEPIGTYRSALAFLSARLRPAIPGAVVAICTTERPEDDRIALEAAAAGVACVRGDELDLIARFARGAEQLALDGVVNVDGDDLFCSPELCREGASGLGEGADVVAFDGYPLGVAPLAFTADALRRVVREKTVRDTATGWRKYFLEGQGFRRMIRRPAVAAMARPDIRLTLDYPQDLEVFRRIEARLRDATPAFETSSIIEAFDAIDGLAALNAEVEVEYWRRYNEAAADKQLP